MKDIIQLAEIQIEVTRKDIKNVHLSVHPPDGRVSLSAPLNTRLEVARAYAISKLGWIRLQQEKLAKQPRETSREYVKRESHYLWGRRYLLNIVHAAGKQQVTLEHKRINLYVRPGSSRDKKNEVFYEWQKKPKDLVEYVIVHELAHLIVPVHNEKFIGILDRFYPNWREARMELNELPLGHVEWK